MILTHFIAAGADRNMIDISPLPHSSLAPGALELKTILVIVFGIVGALSFLFVAIGGFRYIASQGDAKAISQAKGTIIYAVVGLIVSISAVAIVGFLSSKV